MNCLPFLTSTKFNDLYCLSEQTWLEQILLDSFFLGLNKKINAVSHFGFKPSVNHCALYTVFLSLTYLIHECNWIFILKGFLKGWLIQRALAWIRSHDG